MRRVPGAGMGHHQAYVRLHQPHGAARGAGALAGEAAGDAPAQTPGDHLPHQPDPPGGRYSPSPLNHEFARFRVCGEHRIFVLRLN